MWPRNRSYNRKGGREPSIERRVPCQGSSLALPCVLVLIYLYIYWDLFTCSLGEMMTLRTLRHSLSFCAQYAKIQNVLYFLFCFTWRSNVVDANSENENWWGVTHITLAKVRAAAIWFSCGSTGFFPTKMGLIYLHKKIKLIQLTWNRRNDLVGNNH